MGAATDGATAGRGGPGSGRRVPGVAAAAVAAVALGAVAAGWLADQPDLDRADARAVATAAFERMGVGGARVDHAVDADVVVRPDGARVPVWRTATAVPGVDGRVELSVARADGSLVHLDDRDDTGRGRLLSDAQFARLDGFDADPVHDRRIRRDVWSTVAAVAIACVASQLVRPHGAAWGPATAGGAWP